MMKLMLSVSKNYKIQISQKKTKKNIKNKLEIFKHYHREHAKVIHINNYKI